MKNIDLCREYMNFQMPFVRCNFDGCRRKLKLVQQVSGKCACGMIFCDRHRHSTVHHCTFDYQKQTKEILTKQNPIVTASKINGEVQYR